MQHRRWHRGLGLAACLAFACPLQAQPQWRYHLAFEDGTGARDTLWFIYDTTATVGSVPAPEVDYALGEGGVDMDLGAFNVWLGNWDGDSTKTLAYPYTYFPNHGYQDINAFNYQYPIIIRWDRSLFEAEWLPSPDSINFAVLNGEYFYWFGNEPFLQVFSLMHADSVVVGLEALWSPLFPTTLLIGHMQGDPQTVEEDSEGGLRWFTDGQFLRVSAREALDDFLVFDAHGRLIHAVRVRAANAEVSIQEWPEGLYIFRTRATNNIWYHGKFIKVAP
jgi:hypothetical protein